jgi:hypothetical protein
MDAYEKYKNETGKMPFIKPSPSIRTYYSEDFVEWLIKLVSRLPEKEATAETAVDQTSGT